MSYKKYDVCVWSNYEDKNSGEMKKRYSKVGEMTWFQANGEKEDGFKLELPIFGHSKFSVFLKKPKTAPQDPLDDYANKSTNPDDIDTSTSQIEPNNAIPESGDIPF